MAATVKSALEAWLLDVVIRGDGPARLRLAWFGLVALHAARLRFGRARQVWCGYDRLMAFAEIPATIKEHDAQNNGTPRFVRDTAGFFDGTLRALTRFGCGAWDMVWCVVPGNQEGLPLKPESFF